jgi:drug/metabolite transporter (DMT)-like permease
MTWLMDMMMDPGFAAFALFAVFFGLLALGTPISVAIGVSSILIGLAFMTVFMRVRGVSLATPVPTMHLWRSFVGTTALTTWFFAIAALPLATAMTLNYMSSVWIAAFLVGGALLTQRQGEALHNQGPLLLSVLAGFAGVAMMLRPTMQVGRGHRHVLERPQPLGAARLVAAAHWPAGRAGPAVHDTRLRQRGHPGGGQPAIHGHCVCGNLQHRYF